MLIQTAEVSCNPPSAVQSHDPLQLGSQWIPYSICKWYWMLGLEIALYLLISMYLKLSKASALGISMSRNLPRSQSFPF